MRCTSPARAFTAVLLEARLTGYLVAPRPIWQVGRMNQAPPMPSATPIPSREQAPPIPSAIPLPSFKRFMIASRLWRPGTPNPSPHTMPSARLGHHPPRPNLRADDVFVIQGLVCGDKQDSYSLRLIVWARSCPAIFTLSIRFRCRLYFGTTTQICASTC
jgi:hypothetical protein